MRFLPESPRWLLTKKKTTAALRIIQKAASVNKIDFPSSLETVTNLQKGLEGEVQELQILKSIRQIFKYPRMVVVTVIVAFNWCVVTMNFYGLSLNVGNLGGSLRVNFLLSCTVELVGYVLGWVLLDRLGRKRSHCCFMLTGGLACLAAILPVSLGGGKGLEWVTTGLAMAGKLGVSASFSAIYLNSAEVFPTVIRNVALALSSACGRVGSTVSPYIADLGLYAGGRYGRAIPLVVFGGLALLAGISALFLPETLHRPLPDTLEDAVNFTNQKKKDSDTENESNREETA